MRTCVSPYLWVAATSADAVTVVDMYRPEMPTVAGRDYTCRS